MKVIIPMLGEGSRFIKENYPLPKQLLPLTPNHNCLTYSLTNISCRFEDMIFLVRDDVCNQYQLDTFISTHYPGAVVVPLKVRTRGTLETVMLAAQYVDPAEPVFIHTLDIHSEPTINCYQDPTDGIPGGAVFTIKANSSAYSYVSYDSNDNIIKTAEKEVISDQAAVGIYYFSSFDILLRSAERMVSNNDTTQGEFFLCPVYNYVISDGFHVRKIEMDIFSAFGTPLEYEFTRSRLLPRPPTIGLASDHSGYQLMRQFAGYLDSIGARYIEYTTPSSSLDTDYPDYVNLLVSDYKSLKIKFGFAFCRTGQGVNIAANSHPGIRSALIYNEYSAEYAVKHNDAGVFCIPTMITSIELLCRYYQIITNSVFEGGRHQLRLQKLGSHAN